MHDSHAVGLNRGRSRAAEEKRQRTRGSAESSQRNASSSAQASRPLCPSTPRRACSGASGRVRPGVTPASAMKAGHAPLLVSSQSCRSSMLHAGAQSYTGRSGLATLLEARSRSQRDPMHRRPLVTTGERHAIRACSRAHYEGATPLWPTVRRLWWEQQGGHRSAAPAAASRPRSRIAQLYQDLRNRHRNARQKHKRGLTDRRRRQQRGGLAVAA